jgi:hypothetical protein
MDALVWVIFGAIAGAATIVYWEKIKKWATDILGIFIDAANRLVESIGGGFVYFLKEGRKFYKRLELISKDFETQKYFREPVTKEEIKESDIPQKMLEKMNNDEKEIKVLQLEAR